MRDIFTKYLNIIKSFDNIQVYLQIKQIPSNRRTCKCKHVFLRMPQHNDQGNMQITHGIALYDSLNEEFDNHFCSVYTRSFEFISSIRCLVSRFLQYLCANHKVPSVILLME